MELIVLTAVALVIVVLLVLFSRKRTYMHTWLPYDHDVELYNMVAHMPFTYSQLMEIGNLLVDFEREMKTRRFFRFLHFPFNKPRQRLFQELIKGVIFPRLDALESAYKAAKIGGDDE